MRQIGIWCEHNFQVYSALPIVEKYIKENNIIFFTAERNIKEIKHLFTHPNIQLVALDKYIYHPALVFKKIFELLFVSEKFSFVYKNEFVKKESFKMRLIRKIFFLKIPSKRINVVFNKLNNLFFGNRSIDNHFKIDLLISFTKVYYSHLIPQKDTIKHICIMESWDHPMKFPYYLHPDVCLTWNRDLSKDTKKFQHLNKVRQILPLKFKYIYESKEKDKKELLEKLAGTIYYHELLKIEGKKIILYPTTTSSSGIMHEGEMGLIKDLCETFEGSEYFFYIKPKPNAPKGDYDEFSRFENVITGMYSNNANGSDMLDPHYHLFRFLLLDKAEIIINAGTTFGLEASLLDKKIVQLRMNKEEYDGFGVFCQTYHLEKYVLNLDNVFSFDSSKKDELLAATRTCNKLFSNQLKSWITNW